MYMSMYNQIAIGAATLAGAGAKVGSKAFEANRGI